MALLPSLIILVVMTLAALVCSVRDDGAWLFALFILVALLVAATLRKALAFRATIWQVRSPRILVLHIQKHGR
ncbi:hypothetical protein EHF33_15355 [Deinococcus psychrotolerans]|uniref:Uncharacterized protein n=1 Tax=Deinococcus psychrotolerans TaxID=2489213 RepID=A0A3G8YSQ4_9DEIO|nr:hypothetical protein [Deinococcus psychrotolerans]AZI44266.1 hypothetical protein EHF33_15355 [Deinococcus psychrotolerans]